MVFSLKPSVKNSSGLSTKSGSGLSAKSGSELSAKSRSGLWEVRTEEQGYALLNDKEHQETNRYGQLIDLVELTDHRAPVGQSMYINDNPEVGCNPNRNKQHGFYFNADNCIGCHACESACAEKNDTPAHLAFRSVGYVEGGSYPDYLRLNISMSCNHCDDPVCLKGCPTAAYTKHAEYGAVLQDPDTCFGCNYCTWVCPYNAPQMDPIEGHVSKCNMCVDRLEVGLKPACVSACVGNALDFGIIENIPNNSFQAKTQIPGFPDPEITHPNIRFQQVTNLPDEMKRTDSSPVKYHKSKAGQFQPVIDPKQGIEKKWNLNRLNSKENPLVLFTLMTQASIGSFLIAFVGIQSGIAEFLVFANSAFYPLLLIMSLGLVSLGLFVSTKHLGKPFRFYRGFNNLRYSPVSREGLAIAIYMALLFLCILFLLPSNSDFQLLAHNLFGLSLSDWLNPDLCLSVSAACGVFAIPAAIAGLYYMYKCYRIPARPFWNHWQVATSFCGNCISLGAILSGTLLVLTLSSQGLAYIQALNISGSLLMTGVILESIGLYFHQKEMSRSNHEGAASHYVQTSTFGRAYSTRNLCLVFSIALGFTLLMIGLNSPAAALLLSGWGLVSLSVISTSLVGRALFYVLVIPTTMPGAFFWKNKGFEEHARDIGLANMPQAGIVPLKH